MCTTGTPASWNALAKLGGKVDEATITASTEYCRSMRTELAGSVSSVRFTISGRRPRSCKARVNWSKTSRKIGL